jgi:hypothetical protein
MIDLTKAELTFQAWQAAIDRYAGKTDVASLLRTADWERVPLAIRERAFFSAGVDDARTLQTIRSALEKALQGRDTSVTRPDGTPMSYSRADAIADIRAALGAEGDSGSLTDITSYRRQQLIADFQIEQANSYGRYKRDLGDANLLDAFPAQELVRVAPRVKQRDWWTRWAEAGSEVGWQGASRARMVALKTSPIWAALSRFGTPFPPFDFNSGMGLEDVDYDTAESLGLIPKNWDPEAEGKKALGDFNEGVQASLKDVDSKVIDVLDAYLDGHGLDINTRGDVIELGTVPDGYTPPKGMEELLPAERRAIQAYTERPVAQLLNDSLRNDLPLSKTDARLLDRTMSGLDAMPTDEGTFYRRVKDYPGLDAYQPGATITEGGFTSTSTTPQSGYGDKISMVIQGKTAHNVSVHSLDPSESERLFNAGTKFRITARRIENGVDTIYMEEAL